VRIATTTLRIGIEAAARQDEEAARQGD
jgi:hypothetical protein